MGYGRNEIIDLFAFIDWIMRLPKELEKSLWQEVQKIEEVKKMAYVTSVERIGIEKRQFRDGRIAGVFFGFTVPGIHE